MNIQSIFRHWFTLAATAASVWLISTLVLTEVEAQALTEAFGKLIEPAIVILVLVITALWRIVLAKLPKIFRYGTGESGQGSGGSLGLWVIGATAVCLAGALPSCSPAQLDAAREFPIRACVITEQGRICYSSKAGLSAEIDATSGK